MPDARDKTEKGENETIPLPQDLDLEFHPITIQGDPLSETAIRERR
jgi:hypothetical protein